jgi:hypothetical protein
MASALLSWVMGMPSGRFLGRMVSIVDWMNVEIMEALQSEGRHVRDRGMGQHTGHFLPEM